MWASLSSGICGAFHERQALHLVLQNGICDVEDLIAELGVRLRMKPIHILLPATGTLAFWACIALSWYERTLSHSATASRLR